MRLAGNFDKSASGATRISQKEGVIKEFDFGMKPRNTLIENEYLIGTMPANLGAFLLNREKGSLRAITLLNNQLKLLLLILLRFRHHTILLLLHFLLNLNGLKHLLVLF